MIMPALFACRNAVATWKLVLYGVGMLHILLRLFMYWNVKFSSRMQFRTVARHDAATDVLVLPAEFSGHPEIAPLQHRQLVSNTGKQPATMSCRTIIKGFLLQILLDDDLYQHCLMRPANKGLWTAKRCCVIPRHCTFIDTGWRAGGRLRIPEAALLLGRGDWPVPHAAVPRPCECCGPHFAAADRQHCCITALMQDRASIISAFMRLRHVSSQTPLR